MMSRRQLYAALPAIIAAGSLLGGCNTTKINAAYDHVYVVAREIERAMATARTNMQAAAKSLAVYIIPVCKVVRLVNAFVLSMARRGLIDDTDPKVSGAISTLGALANSGIVTQVANANSLSELSEDPVMLATNILDVLITVKSVIPDARPTTAVASQ